ncbi:hypothetical protein WICPIJ_002354 [Wickerhamomyces pijperi]|uniref:Uncharacterized protein n=1 Tax=Wickerhamomyces pijperi TaxID=599730 RepID=A0A9P8Q9V2_WICPI|nr:hypothetical protein WICPIJ_002354 [Wickerhamomyces pijperi]
MYKCDNRPSRSERNDGVRAAEGLEFATVGSLGIDNLPSVGISALLAAAAAAAAVPAAVDVVIVGTLPIDLALTLLASVSSAGEVIIMGTHGCIS